MACRVATPLALGVVTLLSVGGVATTVAFLGRVTNGVGALATSFHALP
jgi:hypothetical protein